MSEEMEEVKETDESQVGTIENDTRFEVKWRKKESSAPTPAASAVGTPDETPTDDIGELRQQLDTAEKRTIDLQDRWHRAAADLANLRKRTEAERGEVEKFASMMLVAELLPVLDNFERALATIPGNLSMLTWIQGVMLIERHMRAILEHQGVSPIEADGRPFNPHEHEAIGEQETDRVPAGHIARVLQQGYTMHGRVIRPALVELAKAPSDNANTDPESTSVISTSDIMDDAQDENLAH